MTDTESRVQRQVDPARRVAAEWDAAWGLAAPWPTRTAAGAGARDPGRNPGVGTKAHRRGRVGPIEAGV